MSDASAIGRGTAAPALVLRLLSDERLARRSAAGETAAFGVLFERHHQPVYRYCRSILGDADEAADALQSTMEKALAAIARRDPAAPLRAWLFRIAHNESVSLLRRRGTRATEPLEPDTAIAPDVAVTAERRERLAQLVHDLGELPERQRGALLMREVGGLSHSEIAAAFAVSVGAVKQSICEARVALHDEARGRDMSCEAVRRTLSEGDGRTARQRRIRAHLRACDDCRLFHAGLQARSADLAMLTPLLPGPAAAAVLAAITGAGAGAGGGGGLLAGLLGGGGGASSVLAKSAAVGAITLTAGAVTLTSLPGGKELPVPRTPAKAAAASGAGAASELARPAPAEAATPPSGPGAGGAASGGPREGADRDDRGGGDRSGRGRDETRGERSGPGDRDDDDDRDDRSGPGGAEDDDERDDDEPDDRSGPDGGGEPDDHSGPGGGGEEEPDDEPEDRSGSSGSGSGSSGSGSGSSGPGSGGDPETEPADDLLDNSGPSPDEPDGEPEEVPAG